jgi:hypothetical protein
MLSYDENLQYDNEMQFCSWVRMLKFSVYGHAIQFY